MTKDEYDEASSKALSLFKYGQDMAEQSIDTQIVKEKVMGKGKAIEKAKAKEKSFHWTEALTLSFFEVLRAMKRNNGYTVAFTWPKICSEFEEKTKIPITPKAAQNKYNNQKKLWTAWGKIRNMETGVGWEEETGRIVADEEWWLRKKAELGDVYNTFRRKGVKAEISDLWDDIYTELVASGKHAVAPSMEPGSVPLCVDDAVRVHSGDDDLLDIQLEKDAEEDNGDIMQTLVTQPGIDDTLGTLQSQSKGKSPSITTERAVQKKRKRQSPSAVMYNQQLASVEETGKQMLTLMKSDFEASTTGEDNKYDEAIGVLDRLVENDFVEGGSDLWCFAMTQMENESRRRTFMKIKSDDFRVKWLAHEYRNSGKV